MYYLFTRQTFLATEEWWMMNSSYESWREWALEHLWLRGETPTEPVIYLMRSVLLQFSIVCHSSQCHFAISYTEYKIILGPLITVFCYTTTCYKSVILWIFRSMQTSMTSWQKSLQTQIRLWNTSKIWPSNFTPM